MHYLIPIGVSALVAASTLLFYVVLLLPITGLFIVIRSQQLKHNKIMWGVVILGCYALGIITGSMVTTQLSTGLDVPVDNFSYGIFLVPLGTIIFAAVESKRTSAVIIASITCAAIILVVTQISVWRFVAGTPNEVCADLRYFGSCIRGNTGIRALPTREKTTSTNDGEFTQWHTYGDGGLGFMFEYPAAYDTDKQYENCSVKQSGNGLTIGSRSYIENDSDDGLTLRQFAQKKIEEYKDADWKIEQTTDTWVGDEKALSVDYRFGGVSRYGNITFVHRGTYFYIFSFEAGAFACGDEPSVYEHLLKTFKWVDYAE